MPCNPADQAVAHKVNEIKSLPYGRFIVSEDVIERNFGYKIIRQQVSHGRNSVIYKCESVKYPNSYCLIKPYKMGKDRIKQSLREETCQILRYVSARCAQIISTYDIYYTNEKIYLMCDWSAKGEVLAAMRTKSIRLTEELVRLWATDILTAIAFLHSNAICHRNVAPNCLLLTAENRVKIGSLSDAVIFCKPDGSVIKQKWPRFSRTLNWNQAPEVAKGKPYDPRQADIWSIGATIFWFTARTWPIDYRSSNRMTKQLDHKISLMRKVSSKCQAFVRRMLTFQPAQRPSIEQAQEMEWITGAAATVTSPKEVSTRAEPAASAEITTNDKVDTGETAGPGEGEVNGASAPETEPTGQVEAPE